MKIAVLTDGREVPYETYEVHGDKVIFSREPVGIVAAYTLAQVATMEKA